jgi:hypothetical protein
MAAVDYYMAEPGEEERLNIQARDIAQRTLLFQAQLRGFLVRNRMCGQVGCSDSEKKRGFGDIYGFSKEVVHEKRNNNTDQISNYNTEKDKHDVSKNSVYSLNLCQEGTSEEVKSIELRTQRLEPIDSSTIHCESGYHYI